MGQTAGFVAGHGLSDSLPESNQAKNSSTVQLSRQIRQFYRIQSWYQNFGQCIKVDRHALTKESTDEQNET